MPRRYGSFTIRPWLARTRYQQSPDEPGDRRAFEGIASHKHPRSLVVGALNSAKRWGASMVALVEASLPHPLGRQGAIEAIQRAFTRSLVGAPAKGLRDNLYGGRRSVMGCVDSTLGSVGPYRGGVCDPTPPERA